MKIVEYDRLARKPCRGRAAGVNHLSQAPLGLNKSPRGDMPELPLPPIWAETLSTDPYPARRSCRTLAVTRTASGRASTADPGGNGNSARSPRSVREVHAHPAV